MISIPEPCNEDFTKMTPTERGAFCSKCEIDTFDFRKLSDSEINTKLLQNKDQHLCGQFTDKQLSSLNRGFINWKYQKKETFRSKFILALVLVFGLSLFSCDTEDKNKILEMQGVELGVVDSKMNYVSEVIDGAPFDLKDYLREVEDTIEGEIQCVPGIVEVETNGEIVLELNEDYVTAGVPMMYPEPLAGALVAPDYWDYLEDTTNLIEQELIVQPDNLEVGVISYEATAFPNPTTSNATLKLDIKVAGQFEIQLLDLSGRMVRSVYSGELSEGEQRFPVELSQEPSGMYFVNISSNGQRETVKIQKLN